MEDSFVFFSFVLINLLDLNLPLLHILTRENNKIGWIKLQIILRSQTMNLSLLFIRILYQLLRRRPKSNNIDSFLIDRYKVLSAQQCSIAWTFPELKALVSIHQWLSTLMILVDDHDCINVDEDGFVRDHNLFESILFISQDVDRAITDFKGTFPLKYEAILASRIWILERQVQNVESQLTF